MSSISVVIIVKNEEMRISRCLESVSWADEIIVVDSGSSDRTPEICRSFQQVKFFDYPWEGFGKQKNRALGLATSEWVFSLDADETVSPELAIEIRQALHDTTVNGYLVNRKNFYRNQWIRHSGWWPDSVLRLFRRGEGRFSDRLVHEAVELDGRVGTLSFPLEHRSFSSVTDFVKKMDSYSTLGAQLMMEKGRAASPCQAFLHGLFTFFKTYILKRGFLDGRAGLLIAFSNAAGVFYRYMKRLEIEERVS